MSALTAQNLLRAALRGDNLAVEKLLDAERSYLRVLVAAELDSALRRKVGESDIVQESMLDVQRSFAQFRGQSVEQWRKWAGRIVANNVRDARRKFLHTEMRDADRESDTSSRRAVPADTASSPSAQIMQSEQLQALRDDLATLPSDYQQALRMRYWEQLPYDTIAAKLNTTTDAARKKVFRALKMLLDVQRRRNF